MSEKILCSVVIPVYNEELVILETYNRLKSVMGSLNEPYELVFVNDGSRDKSAAILDAICKADQSAKLVDFSRNFGHQMACTAGMDYSSGETIVLIDADLQDPPELIPKMLEKWHEGFDVVYGVRIKRKGETFFKKFTSKLFYRLLNSMTEVEIPLDTGDFRLVDRRVCDALKTTNERSRYLRGLISWMGFRQTGLEYVRDKRFAGETKYPLKKMLKFAFDGITSFSYKPLKLATYFGSFISILSFLYLLIVIYQGLFTNSTVTGWASTLAVSLFFNGIVLIILGIMGEYIGRIFDQVKGRPLYIVRDIKNIDTDKIIKR
jgi:glycosyltransferase involved in cell wall biosynthesis